MGPAVELFEEALSRCPEEGSILLKYSQVSSPAVCFLHLKVR